MIGSMYLGDGAYVSKDTFGNLIFTTNSHLREEAVDTVCVENRDIDKLLVFARDAQTKKRSISEIGDELYCLVCDNSSLHLDAELSERLSKIYNELSDYDKD